MSRTIPVDEDERDCFQPALCHMIERSKARNAALKIDTYINEENGLLMNKTPKEVSNIELKEKKRDDKPVVKQM